MSLNNFLEQLEGLGRFGADAYESGVRAREARELMRKTIFSVTGYKTAQAARELLETYIHEFGNPQAVPDVFFEELNDTIGYIRDLERYAMKYGENINIDGEEWNINELIAVHCEEFKNTASKILRLAYREKESPMVLPKTEHFRSHKKDPISEVFGE